MMSSHFSFDDDDYLNVCLSVCETSERLNDEVANRKSVKAPHKAIFIEVTDTSAMDTLGSCIDLMALTGLEIQQC